MLINFLAEQLKYWQQQNLHRQRFTIDEYIAANIMLLDNKKLINFSHNDYLCLAHHPEVKKHFIAGVKKYGLGSGAAWVVSGYHSPHQLLEEKMAEFLQRDRAILFSSGYLANTGLLPVIAQRNSTIISDKLCHASLLDGIQLSRAKHLRYPHQDFLQAENLLQQSASTDGKVIVTEGVFSMEGDITPINELTKLSRKYSATLIVDDAHGIGVLGKNGRGVCEYYALNQSDVPCLVIPLGKAFGSMGAIVSGPDVFIEALVQFAKTYRYSTALPPALAYASIASLTVLQKEPWRLEMLQDLIQFFIIEADKRKLSLISRDLTPIKSILIKNNKRVLEIKKNLHDLGFFVSCIRPPTVPKNTARIRLSLNCFHQKKDIITLLDALAHENIV